MKGDAKVTINSQMEELLVEVKEGIAILTLNRPDKLNALTPSLFIRLSQICSELSEDESIKVAVITGAGRGFCVGADVGSSYFDDVLSDKPPREILKDWPYEKLVSPVGYEVLGIWNCIKPTIASVNGIAVGGGLGIAAACDIRIASENARFGFRFSALGIVPDAGSTYTIPRLIGFDKAFELYCTDSIIDAQEALRIGLVTKVVPHEELTEATMKLAEKIADGPSLAQILTKRGMREGVHNSFLGQLEYESYALSRVRSTQDYRNAVLAFLEKRKAEFTGR